jgi:outer membrane protein assembly factor BamB
MAVAEDGSLFYADLDLDPQTFQPGDDGKVWRVGFDPKGSPRPPVPVLTGLAFPDGLGFLPGDLQVDPAREWRSYAGGPERKFYGPEESILTPENVGLLRERWRFPTGAVVTGSPAVAVVELPGEGPTQVVYFQSWDGFVYAVRLADGSEVWRFATDPHPGASFPGAASPHVEDVGGSPRVFIASGETMYALDAASGAELWRFVAGTGCADANGDPPGLCDYWDGTNPTAEQNQIESSGGVAEGLLFFGMDVDDDAVGKGGFYAVDASDGRLAWFFDLESGMTCTPAQGEEIRRFDGYHSEAELGLPAGFRSRPGCDFPFERTGCGNVWSSAAIDLGRRLLFTASSNCDTDSDPATGEPEPPMPDFDEAIFALGFDGTPRWRWRPREVDNADLAFGAVPNLFSIRIGEALVDVVGVGSKDGSYTVIDRDGVNEANLVRWDDADPSGLPYWRTQVVPGGALGGVIATAAVDEDRRRVLFSTAPGGFADVQDPQRPTLHALDMDGGAVVWDSGLAPGHDASFGPTSAIPGLMLAGSVLSSQLRFFETEGDAGSERLRTERLVEPALGFGDQIASGAVVINGTVLVGTGSGQRGPNPFDPGNLVSNIPSPLVALCLPGAPGCPIPSWQLSDLDLDLDVDADDRAAFTASFGRSSGDAAFDDLADLDRDGRVSFVDYQQWLAGQRQYEAELAAQRACGLLGIEPLGAWLALRAAARLRRRGGRTRRAAASLALALAGLGAGLAAAAAPAGALVIVRVEAPTVAQPLGVPFEVRLVADVPASEPTLAWGLDLAFDPSVLALSGAPAVGPLWNVPVATQDGDGLAGAFFPELGGTGITGTGVLLATLSFRGISQGTSALALGVTGPDLTEGFALDPAGFAEVQLVGGSVGIVPEPASGLLLAAALGLLAASRRSAH